MRYKIVINRQQCVGHARCAHFAPHLYPLDSNGYIASDGFDVPEGEEQAAAKGARSCPERVITMLDENGNKVLHVPKEGQ